MHETTIRRRARKQGVTVYKDRARKRSCDHQGGYMLVSDLHWVVGGERYDMTLDDVDRFLRI